MGKLDGKVALITGGARGQGRSHALTMAREGASIVICDVCEQLPTVSMPMSNEAEMAETVRMVEDLDRRCVAIKADVRDTAAMQTFADQAMSEFGRIDILCANAGIATFAPAHEMSDEVWDEMIAVNLTGVWKSCRAVIPHMIAGGRGGSIIITSSTAGLKGFANLAHYASAKHGVVGLMRVLAIELAQHSIRVNSIHPTTVNTPMVINQDTISLFAGGNTEATLEDVKPTFVAMNLMPQPWVEAEDISNAVLFLASDDSRFMTGVTLPVDLGFMIK
ncbi:MAG: mycofactocin-coupled SDR family oxidoreductase [Oscillochloridaceae bacterium umkhey_bin13]